MLANGDIPNDFNVTDHNGKNYSLGDFKGSWTVLFFYPKASTPGCTKEACAFRDRSAEFSDLGCQLFGVSADTVKRQTNFANKYELTMPLLADTEHSILAPWGIWGEKKMYGKVYEGIIRTTVLLDPQGKVAHVWSPVRVKGHVDAVYDKVKELAG